MKRFLPITVLLLGFIASGIKANASSSIFSTEDLPCSELKIKLIDIGADLITPKVVDPKPAFARAFAEDKTLAKRLANAGKQDPAGLCHYRDENQLRKSQKVPVETIFIGDSITEGWGKAAHNPFTDKVLNRGIAGQTTTQMLLRFRQDVLALRPSTVHILAGTNDVSSSHGILLAMDNISSMVELAQANHIQVVLSTLPPSDHYWLYPKLTPQHAIRQLNKYIIELAQDYQLRSIDYYTPLDDGHGGLSDELSNDGLHPNERGYEIMFASWIQKKP